MTATVDLEALTPRALASLCAAATVRALLTTPPGRPALRFWTARPTLGRHVLVLGKIEGKVTDPPHGARPADATAFVRVSVGDVWDWLLANHRAVALQVEQHTNEQICRPGFRRSAPLRVRVLGIVAALEAAGEERLPAVVTEVASP